jgi:hypothetical protein
MSRWRGERKARPQSAWRLLQTIRYSVRYDFFVRNSQGQVMRDLRDRLTRLARPAWTARLRTVLRQANLPAQTTVPWWGNRTLRYEFA